MFSAVTASLINSNSSTISWTTDEGSNSQVRYGTSSGSYINSTTLDPTMVTSHSQALSGLQPSTTYYYQVLSTDNGGNQSISAEYSFTTANLTIIQPYPALGKDTYFDTTQPTWNRGVETSMSAGDNAASGLGTIRSAIRFDLSGIPVSATIKSANLSLYQMGQGDPNPQTLNVHYLTRDWAEGTGQGSATGDGATWNTYNGVNNWTAAGGDFNGAASGSATAPNSTVTWVNWDLTTLTQSWVNTSVTNYGVIIKQNVEAPAGTDYKSYYSSDYTLNVSLRPKITIEWFGNDTTPPAVGEIRAENVTRTSTDIKWSTDEQANSQVEYGTTTSYGSSTSIAQAMVNQHTVALPGLTEDTVYHYRVKSTDLFGNTTVSGDHVFQTAKLVTIQPASVQGQDTWITNSGATLNYGGSTDLNIGNQSAASDNRRSLLKFDLSAIPVGSTINSATMSLYQHAQQDATIPQLGVYYATHSWTEGTGNGTATADGATWNSYNGISNWTSSGGDFNGTAQATATARSSNAWVDFSITGLAQSWVSGTFANEGMFVKKSGENPAVSDYKTFYSSDYLGDSSLRPKLVIEYVPAPGSMTLTINETYNRDASPGGGSVGFGNVSPGSNYDVGEGGLPPYAVKLQIKSNTMWGLKVVATGDLAQSNPLNTIDIANLKWKQDGEAPASYHSMDKTPAETVILSGQPPTDSYPFFFDYRLAVPSLAVSGSYSTTVVYTAYPS
ncbi:MAG: DNRLRE domain-containing protein [Thermoleophilia bacterium]|nr:DNRLRE domain-containing protein [Thermoleophilia bacterium]